MTMLKDASSFVTNFKGAALSCLILMWSMRDTKADWTCPDLAELTGYSRATVAQALHRLEVYGLVIRLDRVTWKLRHSSNVLAGWPDGN